MFWAPATLQFVLAWVSDECLERCTTTKVLNNSQFALALFPIGSSTIVAALLCKVIHQQQLQVCRIMSLQFLEEDLHSVKDLHHTGNIIVTSF